MASVKPKARKRVVQKGDSPGRTSAFASQVFKLVGDPTRFEILTILDEVGERSLANFRDDLTSPSTASALGHHLALLRHSKLIQSRREGKTNVYELTALGRSLVCFSRDMGLATASKHSKAQIERKPSVPEAILEAIRGVVDDPEVWMLTPNPIFEHRRPIDLIGKPEESRLWNRIGMAKHGMFS